MQLFSNTRRCGQSHSIRHTNLPRTPCHARQLHTRTTISAVVSAFCEPYLTTADERATIFVVVHAVCKPYHTAAYKTTTIDSVVDALELAVPDGISENYFKLSLPHFRGAGCSCSRVVVLSVFVCCCSCSCCSFLFLLLLLLTRLALP